MVYTGQGRSKLSSTLDGVTRAAFRCSVCKEKFQRSDQVSCHQAVIQAVTAVIPSSLEISSSGGGCAMVQSVLRYNTREVSGDHGFTVAATPLNVNSVVETPELRVCAAYSGTRVRIT